MDENGDDVCQRDKIINDPKNYYTLCIVSCTSILTHIKTEEYPKSYRAIRKSQS